MKNSKKQKKPNETAIKSTQLQINTVNNKFIIGDSWDYMPPILVPFSAKRIATQMVVIEELNERKDFSLKGFVGQDRVYEALCCTILKLFTNSIWTYTWTALLVNQWKIFVTEFTSDFDSG